MWLEENGMIAVFQWETERRREREYELEREEEKRPIKCYDEIN